jgi:dolichol kinase
LLKGEVGETKIDKEFLAVAAITFASFVVSFFFPYPVAVLTLIVSAYILLNVKRFFKNVGPSKMTIVRKLPHVVGGLVLAAFLLFGSLNLAVGLTAAAAASYVLVMFKNDALKKSGSVMGMANQFGLVYNGNGSGKTLYLSSPFYAFVALSALYLFASKEAALAGILALALGDTAAAVVGIHGKIRLKGVNSKKTLEGSIAMFIVTLMLIYLVSINPLKAVLAAAVATIVEAAPLPLDDNLLIPLFTAIVFQFI